MLLMCTSWRSLVSSMSSPLIHVKLSKRLWIYEFVHFILNVTDFLWYHFLQTYGLFNFYNRLWQKAEIYISLLSIGAVLYCFLSAIFGNKWFYIIVWLWLFKCVCLCGFAEVHQCLINQEQAGTQKNRQKRGTPPPRSRGWTNNGSYNQTHSCA